MGSGSVSRRARRALRIAPTSSPCWAVRGGVRTLDASRGRSLSTPSAAVQVTGTDMLLDDVERPCRERTDPVVHLLGSLPAAFELTTELRWFTHSVTVVRATPQPQRPHGVCHRSTKRRLRDAASRLVGFGRVWSARYSWSARSLLGEVAGVRPVHRSCSFFGDSHLGAVQLIVEEAVELFECSASQSRSWPM